MFSKDLGILLVEEKQANRDKAMEYLGVTECSGKNAVETGWELS